MLTALDMASRALGEHCSTCALAPGAAARLIDDARDLLRATFERDPARARIVVEHVDDTGALARLLAELLVERLPDPLAGLLPEQLARPPILRR